MSCASETWMLASCSSLHRFGDQALCIMWLAVVQALQHRCDGFGKLAARLQFLSFLRECLDFIVGERQCVEFGDLKLQQFEPRRPVGICCLEIGDLLRHRLPFMERGFGHGANIVQAAEIVEQVPLHLATPQRLMKMLAMDVQQQLTKRFEALQWYGIAVNECTRASVCIDHPAKIALVIKIQHLLLEPQPRIRQVLEIEFGRELGTVCTAAYQAGAAAFAEHQPRSMMAKFLTCRLVSIVEILSQNSP
jgi:hypothetical protein